MKDSYGTYDGRRPEPPLESQGQAQNRPPKTEVESPYERIAHLYRELMEWAQRYDDADDSEWEKAKAIILTALKGSS